MTTTAPPSSSSPRPPPPRSRSTPVNDPLPGFAVRAVALLVVGYLVGGPLGAAAVAVGVASTYRRSAGIVAAGAAAMLVVAALATVIETPVNAEALRSRFATDRPVAAAAGLIAALFALTSVVTQAARERAVPVHRPSPARDAASATLAARMSDVVRTRPAMALGLGVAALAGVVLLLVAPGPPEATQAVARSVRSGVGWGPLVTGTVQVDGTQPPVPVIVSAVAPGGARVWTALAGAAAVALVATFVSRHRSRALTLVAVGATAVGLVACRADLAGTLGAALVAGALALGDPDGRTAPRAAAAGALVGGACLCLPVLVVLSPVVVVAVAGAPGRRVAVGHAMAAASALVVSFAPWLRWVRDRFGTWSPAARIEVPVSTALAVAVPLLATGATLLALPVKARSSDAVEHERSEA